MGKFQRSWALAKASFEVLRADKELLVFPLVAAIAAIVVAASFFLPMLGLGLFEHLGERASPMMYVWGFGFYLVQYFVIFFFNSALVGAAMIRLDGGDPTVADGFRIARSKWLPILGYAAIAATVGLILRALEQRAGFIGRIAVGFLGVAWTVTTYLTVPVLVARDVGPVDAVKQSAVLLKNTWGENLYGNGGIGLVLGLFNVALILVGVTLVGFLFAQEFVGLAVVVGVTLVLAVMLVGLVQAALSGIYSAALYRFAVAGDAPQGFDGLLLKNAFQRKV